VVVDAERGERTRLRRPGRRTARRRFRRASYPSRGLDALAQQQRRVGTTAIPPLEVATPPTPTVAASTRTGSHLTIRLTMLAVVVAALFGVLLLRLWTIQVVDGASLNTLARAVTTRDIELQPPRGDIVARSGQVLATDISVEEVTISKFALSQNPFVEGTLSALLKVPVSSITSYFATDQFSPYTPIPVPTGPGGVTPQDVVYIESHGQEFPGVTVTSGYTREYPYDSLAAQMLGYARQISSLELPSYTKYGYTDQDSIGQSGLEEQYELPLHGKPGIEQVEVNPFGNIVSTSSTTSPMRGDTLVLNMDLGLEQELTKALDARVAVVRAGLPGNGSAATPAPWASGVVMDDQTGAVLAMTSYPSYNDNLWSGRLSPAEYSELSNAYGDPLIDYPVDGLQPPGSTFKLATATAALDDGLISAYSQIDDPGSFTLGNQTFYDTAESQGAGELNVTQALTASNDIFFYQLGAWFWQYQQRYGEDAIQKVAAEYGLGENPDIDIPDAATGQVDSPALRKELHAEAPAAYPNSTYYAGDNVEMAFGQGETLVSPLQLAEAYATFANGGTRYAAEMANEVVAPSGKVVETIKPKVVGHVSLPPSTYQPMLEGFEGVTHDLLGTAYGVFEGFPFDKFDVYGKTGTATVSAGDVSTATTAWFVGFGGPAGEEPKYVVVIEVDQGGYGAEAAAPVAEQVFSYLMAHPIAEKVTP
jgi:penicillin-binding protein 2